MSQQDDLVAAGRRLLTNNYRQAPIVMARGEGCALFDVEGRRYLDMTAGIAVCVLGHGHPGLADAIAAQARRLVHVSNLYYSEAQLQLAEALSRRAFAGPRVLLQLRAPRRTRPRSSSRAAIRSSRAASPSAPRSSRSRTASTAARWARSASPASRSTARASGRWSTPVRFVPFGDVAAARAAITDRTAAVIVEPIQAEGGINLPPAGYLQELRRACTDAGAVLIFDEIQTGIGRTGTFYAFEGEGVVPDVVTLAKGLAGGVPIGAMLANEEVARGFEPGTHASTFGGNPFATAAALYVQNAIDELGLLEHCREMGGHLGSALLRLAERRRPKTRGARGRGLLQGLIIDGDPADVVDAGAGRRAAAVGGRRQRRAFRATPDSRQSRDRRGNRDPGSRARRGEVGR